MNRNNTKRSRRMQERKAGKVLMIVFIAVLFVGMFAQIAMIARMTRQNKQLRAVEREIRDLSANADNLNLSLNQFKRTWTGWRRTAGGWAWRSPPEIRSGWCACRPRLKILPRRAPETPTLRKAGNKISAGGEGWAWF